MRAYPNCGRVACLKGYDPESFHFNTRAPQAHFDRQLDVLRLLVGSGLDVYLYLVLTCADVRNVSDKMEMLIERLRLISPNLPLRVSPQKIALHSPVVARKRWPEEAVAIVDNQYRALEAWRRCLSRHYSSDDLRVPCYDVPIRPGSVA